MRRPLTVPEIEAAFEAACHGELQALKPGNVHIHSAGHGMTIETFQCAAAAAKTFIAQPSLSIGQRIRQSVEASFAATGLNTNLGIVLLCVPLAEAARTISIEAGLRQSLAKVLANLNAQDADETFTAIRIANPAGLGRVENGDVTQTHTPPRMTLLEAMDLAKDRDRIARAYVTVFEDIFDVALPAYSGAMAEVQNPDIAATVLHMTLLSAFPDSHIARKWGPKIAAEVQAEALNLRTVWQLPCGAESLGRLLEFDRKLKQRGLNPGTTADFVVATLFSARLSARKLS